MSMLQHVSSKKLLSGFWLNVVHVKASVERFSFVHIGSVFDKSDLDAVTVRIYLY
jgi:hypothetical protein